MASLADPGRGGKQEVARARARALRPRASVLLSRGGRRQGGRWWAGPARGGELGRLGCTGEAKYFLLSLSFISILFYIFYFLQFVFDLI